MLEIGEKLMRKYEFVFLRFTLDFFCKLFKLYFDSKSKNEKSNLFQDGFNTSKYILMYLRELAGRKSQNNWQDRTSYLEAYLFSVES